MTEQRARGASARTVLVAVATAFFLVAFALAGAPEELGGEATEFVRGVKQLARADVQVLRRREVWGTPAHRELWGERSVICHRGRETLFLSHAVARVHIHHGDTLGACNRT